MAEQVNRNQASCRAFFNTITVEPVLFLSTLSWALQSQTLQTLSLYKICHVTLQHSREICKSLNNKTIEKEVQEIENNLSVYRTYIEFIPSLVLSLVLGAWSDSHGRKFPMLFSKFGYLIAAFLLVLVSLIDDWPPETILAFSALIGFTGGNRVFDTAALSYVADVSSPEWRTSRLGFVNAARFLSFPLGTALSGFAQTRWNLWTIFASAAIVRLISFVYLTWRIQTIIPVSSNTRNEESHEEISFKRRLKSILMVKKIKDYISVLFKRRSGHFRFWLLLVFAANWFQTIPVIGEIHVSLLYYRYTFSWGQDMIGYYAAAGSLYACFGLFVCLPVCCNVLKFSDPVVELIGNITSIINPILVAFSTKVWMLWAVLPLTIFYGFVFPAMKSFSSKLIEPDEYGKLFALKDASEVFITFFAGIIYTRLYKHTLDTFPGSIFLLSASFSGISTIIFCIILLDFKSYSAYTPLVESNEDQ